MRSPNVGDEIGVPCEVKPGPFSGEHLVSLETSTGIISGFVRENELKQAGADQWYVNAIVQAVDAEGIEVRIRGSFFTTNGLATFPRELAFAA